MNLKSLLLGIGCFIVGHFLVWFQLNGQFLWKWFRENTLIVASAGVVISLFYIWGTKFTVAAMGGLLWPARFIGFGVGMVIYASMVSYHFGEGINPKTWLSLGLCLILISIQVFWKTP